jgi:hypothetical protein
MMPASDFIELSLFDLLDVVVGIIGDIIYKKEECVFTKHKGIIIYIYIYVSIWPLLY